MAFLPYMETVFEEVFKLLEVSGPLGGGDGVKGSRHVGPACSMHVLPLLLPQCPHLNVRKAAHEALGQFCCALHKACQSCPSEPNAAGEKGSQGQAGVPGSSG